MHIPDNYLSPVTCAVLGGAMIPVWATAVKKVKAEIGKEKLPLLGVGAAFAFLIMMFNVPLPGGTTGHAVGGVLLAILLGPWSACIAVTVALLVQALLFGDGGILSFGANCFNMAFVLPFVGYGIYRLVKDRVKTAKGETVAVALGAYFGLNAAALCTAIEFGLQPILFRTASGQPLYSPYPLSVSIPAMMIPHLLVAGFVEAAFTVAIVAFVRRTSPDALHAGSGRRIRPLYVLLAALVCLSPVGLLAAGTAWGEWSIDEIRNVVTGGSALGYTPTGMANGIDFATLMPDYAVAGFPEFLGYVLSAAVGVALLVIVFKLVGVAANRRRAKAPASRP